MEIPDSSILARGGIFMYPLLVLCIFSVLLFFERVLFLHRGQIRVKEFVAGIKNLLKKGRLLEAITLCEETPGPVASIIKACLVYHNMGEQRMRDAVTSVALIEIPLLERRIGTLIAIARVTPLVGLVGTLVGLLKAFGELENAGAYADMSILAKGFGEALITSAVGVAIAAFCWLAHHFLLSRVRSIVHDMEHMGYSIIVFIQRELPELIQAEKAASEGHAEPVKEEG